MNKRGNAVFFYIAATVCLIFLALYIIKDNPSMSPPAEYTYWEDESSESLTGNQEQYLSSTQNDSISQVSSKNEKTPSDKNSSDVVSSKKVQKNNAIVNINTANVDELCTLEGIGEVLAQRIIDYRNSKGRFNSIEQIMNVKGIAEKKFASIKNHITV